MRSERGSVLAITTGFVLVFTMLGFGAIYFSGLQSEMIQKQAASTRAFWLADAGIEREDSRRGLSRRAVIWSHISKWTEMRATLFELG